jgi:hypothetical protein
VISFRQKHKGGGVKGGGGREWKKEMHQSKEAASLERSGRFPFRELKEEKQLRMSGGHREKGV